MITEESASCKSRGVRPNLKVQSSKHNNWVSISAFLSMTFLYNFSKHPRVRTHKRFKREDTCGCWIGHGTTRPRRVHKRRLEKRQKKNDCAQPEPQQRDLGPLPDFNRARSAPAPSLVLKNDGINMNEAPLRDERKTIKNI